jgi:hypothetical protein
MASPRFWPAAADDLLFSLDRASQKEGHATQVEFWTDNVEAAKRPIEETLSQFDELAERSKTLPSWAPAFLPLDKLLGQMNQDWPVRQYWRNRAALRSAAAALAAERYRLAHGRWPESLAELVPTFMAKRPLDPYDGAPLRSRRLEDGCVIYSIGEDRHDDGGNLVRKWWPSPPAGTDIGFRLWDAARRRRP